MKKSAKPFFGGNKQFTLIRDAVLKHPDQKHRQLIWMAIVFGYDLSKDALKQSQIGGSEDDIRW